MSSTPWIEAYRPTDFNSIVLDSLNKNILTNIILTGHFPNLLFFGPPGTGKTTTIINLIDAYQKKYNQQSKELMIHLNASDERGIDVIRTQINQFVQSKTLFGKGTKFVILDEVDYMTKNAQEALHHMIQTEQNNVRFCLICNYISRIDEGLQNEFIRLRFNQLPPQDINAFLQNICNSEKLNIDPHSIDLIQRLHKSDIRSMINYIQTNQDVVNGEYNIIDIGVWDGLYSMFTATPNPANDVIVEYIQSIGKRYNMDKKNIIRDFVDYIIRHRPSHISEPLLTFVETMLHSNIFPNLLVNYCVIKLSKLLNEP